MNTHAWYGNVSYIVDQKVTEVVYEVGEVIEEGGSTVEGWMVDLFFRIWPYLLSMVEVIAFALLVQAFALLVQ